MKAICALIPAALLAGTILSGPADARGTTGFGAFASDAISKQDYLIVMKARKLGKPKKVGSLKAPKQVAAARKATKKVLKAVDLKPRKKSAKLAAVEKGRKTVAAPKPAAITPHQIVRLDSPSISKVLRSGPRELKKATPAAALPVSGASEVLSANLDPASMGKAPRGGPREVNDVTPGEALKINGASEVLTASLDPASMNKVPRSGPREVNDVTPGEALKINGASEVLTASLGPASMNKAPRGYSREVNDGTPGEALPVGDAGEAQTGRLEPLSMSKVLRSGPREVRATSEARIVEIIREAAPFYGVPAWFALRIAEVESGYNPYARGRAGEIGLYQLKCQTARGMGFKGDCVNLTDARTNVRWGLKHLSLAITMSGGNLKLAASKHNAGLARKSLVNSYVAKVF